MNHKIKGFHSFKGRFLHFDIKICERLVNELDDGQILEMRHRIQELNNDLYQILAVQSNIIEEQEKAYDLEMEAFVNSSPVPRPEPEPEPDTDLDNLIPDDLNFSYDPLPDNYEKPETETETETEPETETKRKRTSKLQANPSKVIPTD